ncbi:MAG: threonine synthase [Gemmataceae bacterium]|nr:threonine synthase [Gemmataceae bacterium]
MTETAFLRCIADFCGATVDVSTTEFRCPRCNGLLDVAYDWDRLTPPKSLKDLEAGWTRRMDPIDFSGVWRFRSLLPFAPSGQIVTLGEGQTLLQRADAVASFAGLDSGRLFLQYEGMNPSGSFKDNGMTAAFTHANMVGANRAACASTGNTSASLAMYCSATGLMKGIVFIGSGKISYGKLAQALDFGALTIQIDGDFDDAMSRVQQIAGRLGIYLVNSVNPFRLEGQKTIMFRVLESSGWEVPDWIVVPGGNLGNVSAFGKAFAELKALGLISRVPQFAVINAAGADTFDRVFNKLRLRWKDGDFDRVAYQSYIETMDREGRRADTLASAIEINRPVNLPKALRAMSVCGGVVGTANDQEIMDAKARVGAGGFGCEPASAASVAGLKKLRKEGVIARGDRVVCILTGHQLKDPAATVAYHGSDNRQFQSILGQRGVTAAPFANRPVPVVNDLDAIIRAIEGVP